MARAICSVSVEAEWSARPTSEVAAISRARPVARMAELTLEAKISEQMEDTLSERKIYLAEKLIFPEERAIPRIY